MAAFSRPGPPLSGLWPTLTCLREASHARAGLPLPPAALPPAGGGRGDLQPILTDSLSIKQVLEPLGLWSDENQRPPPEPRELRVVPVDDAGREIGEAW